jgi:O-antigen ligase
VSATATVARAPALTTAVQTVLLGLAVVLLPFNDLPYFAGVFGELGAEGAFYPMLLAGAALALDLGAGRRIPTRLHWTALALWGFVAWTLGSAAVNLPEIATLYTKGRTGGMKLLLQVVLLLFVVLATLVIFQILRRMPDPLRWFRRWALASFLVAGLYSVFELASYLGAPMPGPIALFTGLIHGGGEESIEYFGRIRSVSGEASWFAMYCSLVFPWILSYFFTARRAAWAPLALVAYLLVLVTLSWSRTAYVITTVQILATVGLAVAAGPRTVRPGRVGLLGAGIALAALAGVTLFEASPLGDRGLVAVFGSLLDRENLSNIGRGGAQAAAFAMARESPMFGVGLGEYGFHMPRFVPLWARQSFEIQLWMSTAPNSPWAPVQSLYARLAAETGYPGLALWLAVWLGVTAACARRFLADARHGAGDPLGAALVVSLIGAILSAINADSLRFFTYWLVLGLAWVYLGRPRLDRTPSQGVTLPASEAAK